MPRASNQTMLQSEPHERATLLQGLESLVRLATESHATLYCRDLYESQILMPLSISCWQRCLILSSCERSSHLRGFNGQQPSFLLFPGGVFHIPKFTSIIQ
jgi:hypothetical protein